MAKVNTVTDRNGNVAIAEGRRFIVCTPNDSENIPIPGGAHIYVSEQANVNVIMVDDTEANVIPNLAPGVQHPIRVKRVLATDTDDVTILLFY
jgi:CDGSH-type Zn-finger protein